LLETQIAEPPVRAAHCGIPLCVDSSLAAGEIGEQTAVGLTAGARRGRGCLGGIVGTSRIDTPAPSASAGALAAGVPASWLHTAADVASGGTDIASSNHRAIR
jgi:hypothetical protein